MPFQIKRKIRSFMSSRSKNHKQISFSSITTAIFITSLGMFFITQLIINAILTPLGFQLESYNTEKDLLIEDNRTLEQNIAQIKSINLIEQITEKKLGLKENASAELIYIEMPPTLAKN